jgi:hypothetical protein
MIPTPLVTAKVDNLTADFVVLVFHPPGFFVFGLADRIQLLGFAKLPPSGGIASAYVGTSVSFKKQGLGSDTCGSRRDEARARLQTPY